MQDTMATPPLQGMANLLEDQGRYGDTELVHMSQPEVRGLQSLGRLTRNPETGLMEAFSIGGFFKDYVAPAALFAIPTIGPYLSAGYTGIKSGVESGNVLTGITSGLLSYGLGKVGGKLFKGMFGGADDAALSAGQVSFKEGLQKGAGNVSKMAQLAGQNPFNTTAGAATNAFNAMAPEQLAKGVSQSVVREGLNVTTPTVKNLLAGSYTPGQVLSGMTTTEGLKNIGTATMKNLMTPETAIRGLASGVVSDLTRTPEYAEATGFATNDSAREPDLKKNKNFAMNTRTEPLSASQILASQMGQPIRYTDPKYSIANTGNISDTLTYAKKGGMLDALDSITEGMEELAEQTDGDVSIEGMIKAAAEGGMMDDVKVNPMSNLQQIAMGQQRPFEGRVMGQGDGMSDEIPFSIEGQQPALLSRDEYVLPADVVAALGNGSSNAGADKLDGFLTDVREKVMGRKRQINQIG